MKSRSPFFLGLLYDFFLTNYEMNYILVNKMYLRRRISSTTYSFRTKLFYVGQISPYDDVLLSVAAI